MGAFPHSSTTGGLFPNTAPTLQDEATNVIMLVGPDLHRYMFVYEALKHAAERCMVAEAKQTSEEDASETLLESFRGDHCEDTLPLTRAWLGLTEKSVAPTENFFAQDTDRPDLLYAAEASLGLSPGFSPFQRREIFRLKKYVTKWGYIAGAGKTEMLMALAHIERQKDPNCLVWIVAATNKVAGDLYAKAATLMSAEEIVHLAVTPGAAPGKFNDHGWNWTQQKVDEAMPVDHVCRS